MTAKKSSAEKELIQKVSKSKPTSKKTTPKKAEAYNPFHLQDPARLAQASRCLSAASNIVEQLEVLCVLNPSLAYSKNGIDNGPRVVDKVFDNAKDAIEELRQVEATIRSGRVEYQFFPVVETLLEKARELLSESIEILGL